MPTEGDGRSEWTLIGLALVAAAVAWCVILVLPRWRCFLVESRPRRPVPWNGWHVLAAIAIYILCTVGAGAVVLETGNGSASPIAPDSANRETEPSAFPESHVDHPIVELLRADSSHVTLAIAWLLAIVVAPLFEELFYRAVLQGWLEKLEGNAEASDEIRGDAIQAPGLAIRAIVISSVVFAAVHIRSRSETAIDPKSFLAAAIAQCLANVAAATMIVFFFRWRCGAALSDFGLAGAEAASTPVCGELSLLVQAGLGLVALVAATGPVYAVFQIVRENISPDFAYSLDPLPLFFLAIVMGFLYQRTHRLLPSLVVHAYFNAIGMALITIEVLRQG